MPRPPIRTRPTVRMLRPQTGVTGFIKPLDPPHPRVANGFWRLLAERRPAADPSAVVEVVNPASFGDVKAKLQSLGVRNLSAIARISLDDHLVVANPGLIAPPGFSSPAAVALAGIHPHGVTTFSVPSWPQTESVIIADDLDLTNKTITIMRDRVSHLWIIARRLIATSGARITYAPLINPHVGADGINGTPNPGDPDFNPHTRQSTSGPHAHDGGAGNPGSPGKPGPSGLDAPDLTIAVLQIEGMPDIVLPGQQGGRGGGGGRGADGGDGQRGRDSKVKKVLGAPVDCAHGPGWGGNGGRGGDGGRGGQGGTGGRGADITFLTPEDQIVPLLTSHAFVLDNGAGSGGDPGPQGNAGNGGQGGDAGAVTGWPCSAEPQRQGEPGLPGNRTGDLGRGSEGMPGQVLFSIITQADWDLQLESPWITSIEPSSAVAGQPLIVHGIHFVPGTTVRLDGQDLVTTFNYAEQLTCTLPGAIAGGEHVVDVRAPDGDLSNSVPLSIRPHILELRQFGEVVTTIWAGDRDALTLKGTSFDPGAALYLDGEAIASTWVSDGVITFKVPAVQGEDPGGESRLKVRNPDGIDSNEFAVAKLPSLDSGFRADPNGWPFENFKHGRPDWDNFIDTFGREEVGEAAIEHPILTTAFYLAMLYYLDNNGHCTALAASSLRRFAQGETDLYHSITVGDPEADPPDIDDGLRHRLNTIQGREFSKEVLVHYADQCRQGVDRVEMSVRDVEESFRAGRGESTATVLCFLPSGNIYDMIADPEVRDAFIKSHCVVPTQLVYGDAARSLHNARLYIYDNNHFGDDRRYVTLTMVGGKVHFEYSDFGVDNGFTLGTAKLPLIAIRDVDLPFSGRSLELAAFIVDVVLSPASLRVETADGAVLGARDGKVHSDPALGYVFPWGENYLLVRADAQATRRVITGRGSGTYTYMTIHPNGTSLTIKEAACSPSTVDSLDLAHGLGRALVQTSDDKQLDIHLAGAMPDGSVRHISLAYRSERGTPATIVPNERLDGLSFSAGNRDVPVRLVVRRLEGKAVVQERTLEGSVPARQMIRLPTGMWSDIDRLTL